MKVIGTWWNDSSIPLVEVGGEVYALGGWNGEEYTNCWKCTGEFFMNASQEEYILQPVYRFQVDHIGLSEIEENSPEFDYYMEIVSFELQ